MAPFTNMPNDVAARAQKTVDAITSGELVIFKGPIKDQAGNIKVAAGSLMKDQEINGMNWLAEGVEGSTS